MTLYEDAANLNQFRQNPWKFQQTFETPLQDLNNFVEAILSAGQKITGGCLTIDLWVFEPSNLINLLRRHSIAPQYKHGLTVAATGTEEVAALLQACLGDWLDFIFVPVPDELVIYADHDEFTTFFANEQASLTRVVDAMASRGYRLENYERTF